ncbi:MAG TPA: Coq4 family protein [Kofleriaceae bacterium]|jgi:ubiquinone biosynthesis protein COQ4
MNVAGIATGMQNLRYVKPFEALRALRVLFTHPEDTVAAIRVVRALDAPAIASLTERLRADPQGRHILAERPSLLATLGDREMLAALPTESLGRTYLAFCDKEGITPGGLVAAADEVPMPMIGEEQIYVANRMRDSHDLMHVVTGYQTDLAGELALLAFSFAQTYSPGVGLLATGGLLESMRYGEEGRTVRKLARAAFVRGRRAAYLPAVEWEKWLARPLADVRRVLRVSTPPVYKPVTVGDLRPDMPS